MASQSAGPDGLPASVSAKFSLELPPDLAIVLHAFCEALLGSPRQRVIREALRRFIDEEIKSNQGVRERFNELKRSLERSQQPSIRVIRAQGQNLGQVDSTE